MYYHDYGIVVVCWLATGVLVLQTQFCLNAFYDVKFMQN